MGSGIALNDADQARIAAKTLPTGQPLSPGDALSMGAAQAKNDWGQGNYIPAVFDFAGPATYAAKTAWNNMQKPQAPVAAAMPVKGKSK